MWIEEIKLDNIKCFDDQSIKMGTAKAAHKWITLLGENGTGKTTILQSLALLLAGPEGAKQLLNRPEGWLKNESKVGKISTVIHQDSNDEGTFENENTEKKKFGYTFFMTGNQKITIRNKDYNQPTIIENSDKILGWLRNNALLPQGKTWFAAGYGAFRRLTRENRILTPSLQSPSRYSNFFTQFQEDKSLEAFESWLVYLDYKLAKNINDKITEHQKQLGINAINELLPEHNFFSKIDNNGKIWFNVNGTEVPTVALSDGFRSVMALAGDLVWRLIEAFPNSNNALKENGVVLIDELDIHLHPTWQREIALKLQKIFPNIQFITATHSPLIALGAGEQAVTYCFVRQNGKVEIQKLENIYRYSVNDILTSPAFNLVSEFSPQVQMKLERYEQLTANNQLDSTQKEELTQLSLFVKDIINEPTALQKEISTFIKNNLPILK
jgi:predicted ATP-binding protein involved in virulence